MRSNPFFAREVGRWGTPEALRQTILYPAVLVFLPWVTLGGLHPLMGLRGEPELGMALSALTWLGLLTLGAVLLGASAWPRERAMGTLPVLTLAGYPSARELWGRWLGGMKALAGPWALGVLLIFGAINRVAAEPTCTYAVGSFFAAWIFVYLWCGAWLAFGMRWSLEATSVLQAMLWVVGQTFVLLLAYALMMTFLQSALASSSGLCGRRLNDGTVGLLLSLPGSPFAPFYIAVTASGLEGAALSIAWALSILLTLRTCAARLAADAPLHAREMAILTKVRALIPVGQPVASDYIRDVPGGPRCQRRGVIDALLAPFHLNPFYAAYRNGFMRLYAGVDAMPGSAWPTGLMYWGVLTFCMFQWARLPDLAVWWLLSGAVPGVMLSVFEAFSLGWQALAAERDRATWPLLLVTGMDGRVILGGKFAAAFYAISGEWIAACPVWLLVLVTPAPAAAMMIFVQPLFIALGILCGFIAASSPLDRLSGPRALRAAVAAVVGGVLVNALSLRFGDVLGRYVPVLAIDPLHVVMLLSGASNADALSQMFAGACRMGLLYIIGLAALGLLWQVARVCVNRLLYR